MTQILDGKALNEKIAQKLKAEISRLETLWARPPVPENFRFGEGPLGRRPKLVSSKSAILPNQMFILAAK